MIFNIYLVPIFKRHMIRTRKTTEKKLESRTFERQITVDLVIFAIVWGCATVLLDNFGRGVVSALDTGGDVLSLDELR